MTVAVAGEDGTRELPERLGPYLIRSRLGAGGMGEVYLAWHELLDRLVALKLIRAGLDGDPERRRRLLAEARAVARLTHPAIVGIHDVFESEFGPCVVMEFVAGRTLAQLLAERGRLPVAEAVALGRDVAEGLAAAHEKGLVHRDLKSDNVMVTPGGRAVILDFGLALSSLPGLVVEPLPGEAGVIAGTPHTMAPEQIAGRADARSDLFSFGVLLYEMLAGVSPFRGHDWLDSVRRVRELEPEPLGRRRGDLPAGLAELVARLLAKNPAARPASARELAATLATLGLESGDDAPTASLLRPIEAPLLRDPAPESAGALVAASPSSPIPRPLPRRQWPAAALTIALALAAGFWLGWPQAPPRRVLVLPPRIGAEVPEGRLLGSALLSAGLAEVAAFGGLAAVDPSQLEGGGGSPAEAARATAADEALLAEVTAATTGNIRVSLRRIGRDGRALYSGSLEVPPKPVDLRWAAEAYGVAVAAAFAGNGERRERARLEIDGADYAAFVAILSATLEDGFATSERIEALAALARRAPTFLPLQQTLGQMALRRFGESRDAAQLELGRETARRCLALAPDDPQALKLAFEAELAGGRGDAARSLLERLEQLGGRGNALALHCRARLADREGRSTEAYELSRRLAGLEPSWQNLYALADREFRLGRVAEAREHLSAVLAMVPDQVRSKTKLAELELLYGDVAAADRLFAELIAAGPRRSLYTNRGLALFLLGRLDEAKASFLAALKLAPGHPAVTLNLADLLAAGGEVAAAGELYGALRTRLEEQRRAAPLSATDDLILAQCLVHLGETRAAVALIQGRRGGEPLSGELAFQAAIVYEAAGDHTSAVVAAEVALKSGVQPRFFDLPVAAGLRRAPALAAYFSSP